MKTIIVYYSLEGNTQYAAEKIAGEIGADLLRIQPKKAYPNSGFRKFLWGGKSAVMAEKPELKPYTSEADRYDVILFGFPVWAGNIAPPVRTFIQGNRPEADRYAAFACQSGAGAEKAFGKLKDCLGHPLAKTLVLIDPKDKPDPAKDVQIEEFCDSLMQEPEST